MKQHKQSVFGYFVALPLKRTFKNIAGVFRAVDRWITGKWYCGGCDKYHHGRVYAFSLDEFLSGASCSLHLDPCYLEKYEVIVGKPFHKYEKAVRLRDLEVLKNAIQRDVCGPSLGRK